MPTMQGQPAAPSRLRVTVAGQTREFVDPVVALGRDAALPVVVVHPDVSRRHVEFRRGGNGWFVVDLQSTNGTFLAGRRVSLERLPMGQPVTVMLGGTDGAHVQVEVVPVAPTPPPAWAAPQQGYVEPATLAAQARQGRATPAPQPPPGHLAHGHPVIPSNSRRTARHPRPLPHCDIVLDDPLVSRQHATPALGGASPYLTDLRSFNGTHVNGRRLTGGTVLAPGDEVIIGNQTFTWTGANLASRATRTDLTLFAENLTTITRDGKRLLEGMSFELGWCRSGTSSTPS